MYTPEESYYVMAQAVRPSVCPLANSCEHNSSYSFQWMILKPSRIFTHGTYLCVKADSFCSSFSYRVMPPPLFQSFAYECPCFPYWGTTFTSGVYYSGRRYSCLQINGWYDVKEGFITVFSVIDFVIKTLWWLIYWLPFL